MYNNEHEQAKADAVHDAIADRDAAIAAKERAEQRASEWEDAAAQGHPTPCTLGPLCPYCEIERLKSALALAVAECEAAHLLLTETYAFDWEFADDMPHDEAYRKARRARTAATTPESPDDAKEDA